MRDGWPRWSELRALAVFDIYVFGTVAEANADAEPSRPGVKVLRIKSRAGGCQVSGIAKRLARRRDRGSDRSPGRRSARHRAINHSDLLLIFLLRARRPAIYNRKTITLAGDPDNPVGIAHSGKVGSNVHFYLPPNHRDEPEAIEADEPLTIEASKEDAA